MAEEFRWKEHGLSEAQSGAESAVDTPKANIEVIETTLRPVTAASEEKPKDAPTTDEDGDDDVDDGKSTDGGGDKPKRPSGSRRKAEQIAALQAKLDVYERQEAERNRAGSKQDSPSQDNAPAKDEDLEPNPDDFATTKDWIKAQAKWEYRQERKAEISRDEQKANEAEKAKKDQKAKDDFQDKVNSFNEAKDAELKDNPAFGAVWDDFANRTLTPMLQIGLLESDMAPKVIQYLSANEAEFEALNKPGLPVDQVHRLLGRIEARLETTKTPETAVSKAPPPIKPVGKPSSVATGFASKYYEGMPSAEYSEWRRKQRNR